MVALATTVTSTWIKYAYLCGLKKRLEKPESDINILIMGGSVTNGAWARGCVCESDSCNISEDLRKCLENRDGNHCCSWPRQLRRWLISKTSARVNFISYAIGGTSSSTALNLYVEKLPKLPHLDLVLLDYSVNDACALGNGMDTQVFNKMEHGMEWLIRRLLVLYGRIRPQLILLNAMPAIFHGGYQYTTAYEKLARHYSIPLWSYNDVAQSATVANESFSKILRWQDNFVECEVHPPWIVHLYTADLYAAIIEKELHRCPSSSSSTSPSTSDQEQIDTLVLPSPITGYDDIHFCELDSPKYLEISAEDIVRKNHHKIIGNYTGGWRGAVEDRNQKWGWIDEFPDINSDDNLPHHSMFFTLRESDNLYQSKKDLILRVAFLKTYNNTGKFDIYLCGMYLQSIDTCWGDPKIRRSTTELSFIPLNGSVPTYCNRDPSPSIEFRHVRVNKTVEDGCDRRHEKVSVIDVTICNAMDIFRSA